ncbi:MAG: hypothetical protein HND50_16320 [Calditrichaeota bacterium]|nr:hypothetical protein [Calditrichota bacterium]
MVKEIATELKIGEPAAQQRVVKLSKKDDIIFKHGRHYSCNFEMLITEEINAKAILMAYTFRDKKKGTIPRDYFYQKIIQNKIYENSEEFDPVLQNFIDSGYLKTIKGQMNTLRLTSKVLDQHIYLKKLSKNFEDEIHAETL